MLSFAKTAGRLTAILLVLVCARPLRAQTQPIQYFYDDLGRIAHGVDSSGNGLTYCTSTTRWEKESSAGPVL